MKILLTGATGLIGKPLSRKLFELGHDLIVVGRGEESKFRESFTCPCTYLTWRDLTSRSVKSTSIDQLDAVINLAGDSLAEGAWTEEKKKQIYDSRINSTRTLVGFIGQLHKKPSVVVSASAIGFYGAGGDASLTEKSPPGTDFLAKVCLDWEGELSALAREIRVVNLRTGIVMAPNGGFLREMEKIFRPYLGGPIGSGNQWMSWIHINDLVRLIIFAIENKNIQGPLNAVAPTAVTNREWTKIFSSILKVPAIIPAPAFLIRAALGEKSVLALSSLKVVPSVALSENFNFEFSNLKSCLEDIYSK